MSDSTVMSRARWERIQRLFDGASAIPADERAAWLDAECRGERGLRDQVAALLQASGQTDAHFEERVEQAIAGAVVDLDAVAPGRIIGRYRVLRLLGRGGMGAVYLAERADDQFQQQVALKLIDRCVPGSTLARRFRAERQILAHLNHPNIARLLDGGAADDGVPYLAMEYIEGTRIDLHCERQQLDIPQRLRLFQQVCAAVQYAHQNLIVHRDVKPSNILVTADGTPKLLDFGIAKLIDPERTGPLDGLTRIHERVLTPEHASPEQVRGEPVGTASDVYSLGVLLYELLSGTRPYAVPGGSMDELEHVICNVLAARPSTAVLKRGAQAGGPSRQLARVLAGDLDNIVLRAMHKEPQRRYPSAAALAEDIQRYLEDRPVHARPDAVTYRLGKFVRRNVAALALTAAVTATIAGLTVFYTLRLTDERDAAERERLTAATVSQFMEEVFRVANPSEHRGNSVTVREVLDAAVQRIDTDLSAEPRVHATLLRTMGQVYNGLGLWNQSRELLGRAVAQERAHFGNEHIELALALASLAGVHHNLSRFDTAHALYEEAWRIRRTLRQNRNAESASLLGAIAGNLRAQQRFKEALEYHARAEALARELTPAQPKVLGQVLQGYAMTYVLTGEQALGERLARESLQLVGDAVYEGNDIYANAVATLAEALRKQFKLEEAGRLQHELLDLQIKRFGNDAPLVARTWNNLAHVLRASGNYAESQHALLEAITIHRKHPGDSRFDLSVTYHNLGGLRNEAGEPERALEALAQALDLKRELLGERSPHMVSTLLEISAAHRELRQMAAARNALSHAESIAREVMDARDRRHAQLLLERARLALARGEFEQSQEAARDALSRVDEEDPARFATIQCVLAEALVARGRHSEARPLLDRALAVRRQIMPAGHWMIADAQSRLGEVLSLQHANGAEELLTTSAARLAQTRPHADAAREAAELRLKQHRERQKRA